jgi:putative nucleotidyltransferase with HDIG domain
MISCLQEILPGLPGKISYKLKYIILELQNIIGMRQLVFWKEGLMRRLAVSQLEPDMITAKAVFDHDNEVLVPRDTVLTQILIDKINTYGILTIYVKREDGKETFYASSERIKNSPEFKQFKRQYISEVDSFKNALNDVVEKNTPLDIEAILQSALRLVSGAPGQFGILQMLHSMRDYDDATYAHCLNVGLICNLIASWMKMSTAETEQLTVCGVLHDIGKQLVPHSIISKPGRLTKEEFAVIQKHPSLGYELLRSQHVDNDICNAVLMHHERCDGTGYPLKWRGVKIPSHAKVVTLADVYDAMTANRSYRRPMCPFDVLAIIEKESLQKYDVRYVLTFLQNVANTYINDYCRLSNGKEGYIIYINKEKLSRPIVKCDREYINLMEHPEITIDCIL